MQSVRLGERLVAKQRHRWQKDTEEAQAGIAAAESQGIADQATPPQTSTLKDTSLGFDEEGYSIRKGIRT